MPSRPTPVNWYSTWQHRPKSRKALKALGALGGSEIHQSITLQRVATACYKAAHYRPESDPGNQYRTNMAAEKERLGQLERAAHVLRLAAQRGDKAFKWATVQAELSSGVRMIRADESSGSEDHSVVAERYFSNLEKALQRPLPELNGGPFLDRFTFGNLYFHEPLAAGRPISTATMLAFELTIYLRMHTAGRAGNSLEPDNPMPTDGQPCYPVVAAFCNATLGLHLEAKQVGENVRKLKNVGLTNWSLPS